MVTETCSTSLGAKGLTWEKAQSCASRWAVQRRSRRVPSRRPRPTAKNRIRDVHIDKELAREAVTYVLESGDEGSVHIDHALEYNEDPSYLAELLIHKLTVEARRRAGRSGLSRRELARRLGTSVPPVVSAARPGQHAEEPGPTRQSPPSSRLRRSTRRQSSACRLTFQRVAVVRRGRRPPDARAPGYCDCKPNARSSSSAHSSPGRMSRRMPPTTKSTSGWVTMGTRYVRDYVIWVQFSANPSLQRPRPRRRSGRAKSGAGRGG